MSLIIDLTLTASDVDSVTVIQDYMDKVGTSEAVHEYGELSMDGL